jgi:hypothetical protein
LRCAVSSLGSAGRQVRVDPVHVKTVVLEIVSEGEHGPGVVSAGDAKTGVSAAIHDEIGMHAQNVAIGVHAGGELHVLAVPASVMGEHLGPVVKHLDRSSGQACEHCSRKLEAGGLQLAPKSTAHIRFDDAHIAHRQFELAGDVILKVVGRLGARVDREFAILPD